MIAKLIGLLAFLSLHKYVVPRQTQSGLKVMVTENILKESRYHLHVSSREHECTIRWTMGGAFARPAALLNHCAICFASTLALSSISD